MTAAENWPQPPRPALHTGLLGEIVSTVEPHTEADPAGLLVDLLVAFGNAVGPGPHFVADAARHPARLFAVLVGDTAKARKGTARAVVRSFVTSADPEWAENRNTNGLSTGEGLIAAVASGDDCRLFVHEPEFARVLRVSGRDGNTLSPVIREAWDTGDLTVLTRGDPLRARGAHMSIIAHITREELRARLTSTETTNGFANRFLWTVVRRSKLLPSGGNLDDETNEELGQKLRGVVSQARRIGRMSRSEAAERLWDDMYRSLAADDPGGLLGSAVSRAEAHLLRLSVAFALADTSAEIRVDHLEAAHGIWQYCRASAGLLFGDRSGDRHADRLLGEVRRSGSKGLNRTEMLDLFHRNLTSHQVKALADSLVGKGHAEWVEGTSTGGRPARYLRSRYERTN